MLSLEFSPRKKKSTMKNLQQVTWPEHYTLISPVLAPRAFDGIDLSQVCPDGHGIVLSFSFSYIPYFDPGQTLDSGHKSFGIDTERRHGMGSLGSQPLKFIEG